MKAALVCFCLLSLAAAWPVNKSKQQATSASSEEKYDLKGHYPHRSQPWQSLQQPQHDLVLPQQTLYSSEESMDVSVPQTPEVPSKSHEDDDDDDDSNDTEESEEATTIFPTDIPLTFPPFTQSDTAGRGDSVAYRLGAKARLLKASKLSKAAQKLIAYDATEEDESALDADSQQEVLSREDSAAPRSLRQKASSQERAGKGQPDSRQAERSSENASRPGSDSREAAGDSSKAASAARGGDGQPSAESRESAASPGAPARGSRRAAESAEEDARDRHSIESNEVTL